MKERNYREWCRLSWEALIVLMGKQFVEFARAAWGVLLIVLFGSRKDGFSKGWIIAALVAFFVLIIKPFITYLTTRFKIEGGRLIVKETLIKTKTTIVPLDKVHAIRTKSNWVYRLVDMVGVGIDTLVSTETELELILTEEELQVFLDTLQSEASHHIGLVTNSELEKEPEGIVSVQYTLRDLVKGAITQNPFKILMALVVLVASFLSDLIDYFQDQIPVLYNQVEDNISWLELDTRGYIYIGLLLLFFAVLATIARVLVKWYRLSICIDNESLRYEAGLITRHTALLPKESVIALMLKQNILEKVMSLYSVTVAQSLMVQGTKQSERISFIGWKHHTALLHWWRADSDPMRLARAHSGLGLWGLSASLYFVVIVGGALLLYAMKAPLLVPILFAIVYGLCSSYLRYKQSAIAITSQHAYIYGGVWASTLTVIPLSKIEGVVLRQSIWQQRSGYCSLVLATMAGVYTVRSLPRNEAAVIRDYLLYRIESAPIDS